MKLPEIPGYQIESLIGKGGSGYVYAAEHESGEKVAIKFLDPELCNPGLIENRLNRLHRHGAPVGVVPLKAHSLGNEPYILISNRYAERVQGEIGYEYVPHTLQIRLASYLGERSSWVLIRLLGQALSAVHKCRVAHGNLKPGNIFLDGQGRPLLSDFTQGLMPGISAMAYSDALLYAPPEQLRDPEGYLEGAGYAWDVYAFSVLAFRLVNGYFPRCQEAFERVAPAPGRSRERGVEADCIRIAENLEASELAPWKGVAPTPEEEGARQIIEKGLALDPSERYSDMVEMCRALETIVAAREEQEADFARKEKVRSADLSRGRWRVMGGASLASALVIGLFLFMGMWNKDGEEGYRFAMLSPEVELQRKAELDVKRDEMLKAQEEAELARDESLEATQMSESLRGRYAMMAEDLAAVLRLNDSLVSWVVERGAEDLPTVEDRAGRLQVLQNSLGKMLESTDSHPLIGRQRWRVELALAELAIASGEGEQGKEHLDQALADAPVYDSATMARLARARVLVCMLGSEPGNKITVSPEELTAAREALERLEADSAEHHRLQAAMQIAQARVLRDAGKDGQAMELYRSSFAAMRKLCEEQPNLVKLRLWRARGYSEAALAAEGFGVLDAASLLRHQSAMELIELLEREPERAEIKLELAAAFSAMAEGDLLSGRLDRARTLAKKAQALLKELPADGLSLSELLVQKSIPCSILAYCDGEVGDMASSGKRINEGLAYLKKALKEDDRSAIARYRMGVMTWQKASQHGLSGNRGEEISVGLGAREMISSLLADGCEYPSPRQLQRSLAYLNGDLGHAALMAGKQEEAVDYFRSSLGQWTLLSGREGGNSEFLEGQEWARDRLRELDSVTAVRSPRN